MKTFRIFSMAAVALMMASCGNEDIAVQSQAPAQARTMPFSATIVAPNAGAQTRTTYSESEDKINVEWKVNDEVALIHGSNKDIVRVTSVTSGTATIEGDITVGSDNEEVTLIYPASATRGTDGTIDPYAFIDQPGTLTGIPEDHDVRKGTGALAVSGEKATLKNNVKLESECAIWKLSLKNGSSALKAWKVTIKKGDEVIASSRYLSTATSDFYLAAPAVSSGNITIQASANDGKIYTFNKNSVSLETKKYYQSTVAMTAVSPVTYDLATITEGVKVPEDGAVLTGPLHNNVLIAILEGKKVTLDNVSIAFNNTASFPGIFCFGDNEITLIGDNYVRGRNANMPGIYVVPNKTLTISGTGCLTAESGYDKSNKRAAGIGAIYSAGAINVDGTNYYPCGNILIKSGCKVTAIGGKDAAAIGGAGGATCGTITIESGAIVTAMRYDDTNSNNIGAGTSSTCGTITIGGATQSNIHTADGLIYYYPNNSATSTDLSTLSDHHVALDGDVLTGTLSGNKKISIAPGATVTLNGVTIPGGNSTDTKWAGINCLGDATIILTGTNSIKGFDSSYPAIHVPVGNTLTIKGEGSLQAHSNTQSCGIGGGRRLNCGNIVIQGGTITTWGSEANAAIGSGMYAECGDITISGGTVTATGAFFAACIGTGHGASFSEGNDAISKCGDITLSGGTITVTRGFFQGTFIGKGYGKDDAVQCGTINTTGADITEKEP